MGVTFGAQKMAGPGFSVAEFKPTNFTLGLVEEIGGKRRTRAIPKLTKSWDSLYEVPQEVRALL